MAVNIDDDSDFNFDDRELVPDFIGLFVCSTCANEAITMWNWFIKNVSLQPFVINITQPANIYESVEETATHRLKTVTEIDRAFLCDVNRSGEWYNDSQWYVPMIYQLIRFFASVDLERPTGRCSIRDLCSIIATYAIVRLAPDLLSFTN